MEREKNKSSINIYANKNISELNELIYAGAKLGCGKIGVPLKSTYKKSKAAWGIRLETMIKQLKTDKNDKTRENRRNMF